MAFLRVRHPSALTPDGCRWCGDARSSRGHTYSRAIGGHFWEQPTPPQRLARMRARRARGLARPWPRTQQQGLPGPHVTPGA
ncbi:hypothetical protein DZF97_09925 [Clavibacter nebraskensis]|uniref:Uncharacterized protein n=1 Tax=Clavibacter nebraskensis TaxID=31963 RepID=A0A399PU34_9MICO|nr:hypothetical protein DZF97_09925 [Clavibacter nebraskensis]